MAIIMEVEIISTEKIKPSSPTPNHLKTFKLSLLDQLSAPVFSKLVHFYLPSSSFSAAAGEVEKSKRLKTSLSEILSLFYPFAGRIKGNLSIDCNDDGAIYVEARVRRRLVELLEDPSDELVEQFLPIMPQFTETESGYPVLSVQTSFFECGGVAIGLLFSHKMVDAASMSTFTDAWATAARGSLDDVHPPELMTGASLFPQKELLANLKIPYGSKEKIITKRFVFATYSMGLLKSKAIGNQFSHPPTLDSRTPSQGCLLHYPPQARPTRVESVSALIWKCAVEAARSNSPTKKPASFLLQSVNLRTRFTPPLPQTSTGNIVGYFPVEEDEEIKLPTAVAGLKSGLIEFCDGHIKKLQEIDGGCAAILEGIKVFDRGGADTYTVTSWCRFPMKEVDFGWGKPVWVATACLPFKNVVVLMDGSDEGGIEAWVCLKEEDMSLFERDQELLAYASLNPPVSLP